MTMHPSVICIRAVLCVTLALLLDACAQLTPEYQIIDNAVHAVGGRERALSTSTLIIDGEGTQRTLGQDVKPYTTERSFTVTNHKRSMDLAGGRIHIAQVLTPDFPWFLGQAPRRLVQGVDGNVGMIGPTGTVGHIADAADFGFVIDVYHHPLTSLRAAHDPAATLTNFRSEAGQDLVDVRPPHGTSFTLAVDSASKLPIRVLSRTANTNLGDVIVETTFSDYRDIDGVKLPTRLITRTDSVITTETRVLEQHLDSDAAKPHFDELSKTIPFAKERAPPVVAAEELAAGVWLLANQRNNSVLVEFKDHLMLIEAPLNDALTLAMIAKARELRPDKPLTHVTNTHHHFDHSGGIRAAVSQGLTIIAHKSNASFLEDIVKRPHTIVPDVLAKNPRPIRLETVPDKMVLSDGHMTVELYAIKGNPHADALLVAYFPKERLLVEADMCAPAFAASLFASNLLQNLQRHQLRIERIVPLHGPVLSYAELMKSIAAAAPGPAQ